MSDSSQKSPFDYLVKPSGGDIAAVLADLASYENDLRRADRSLELMTSTADIELLSIYWDHAIVIYSRVFASGGVRCRLNTQALREALTPESRPQWTSLGRR